MIVVVGSVGLDDVETKLGKRTRTLGGACTYFSAAASLYDQVAMVAVVGKDFPSEHIDYLSSKGVDLRGLQIADGKTFFWAGRYSENMDEALTLDTQLNVFANFQPNVPDDLRNAEYLFLANIDPSLQIHVLEQMKNPRVTALDSMNFWITSTRENLTRAMSMVDIVFLNETETRLYSGIDNLCAGARAILTLGPRAVVIKRGQYGSMLLTAAEPDLPFFVPAYPTEKVVDPTGAGDTFAAGFMGYIAQTGDLSIKSLRQAVVHGTVVASFTVEDFSIDRLRQLSSEEVDERYDTMRLLTHFDPPQEDQARIFEQPFL